MNPISNDGSCLMQSSAVRLAWQRQRVSMTEIFRKCRQRVDVEARQAVELVKKQSQELLAWAAPNSESRNEGITKQGFWNGLSFDEVATGILVLIIVLMLCLGLYLVRSYNRACAYGSGGCLWPMLWGKCQIMT